MAEQLSFDLPCVTALGREDFMVAPSNAIAVAMIENWQAWTGRKMALTGPLGSGKTHLVQVWATASGATVVQARDLRASDVPELSKSHVAVEDVPQIAGDPEAETALFHLHNLVLAEGHSLLLTGTAAVPHWGIHLPDLISRLGALSTAELRPPDDTLLTAVLAKLFADRQIVPKPDVIAYLIRRMDRSFDAARTVVAEIDALSLSRKKPVTRGLASDALDKLV
jgi:chromosomal replication initiation ATPase DnaA